MDKDLSGVNYIPFKAPAMQVLRHVKRFVKGREHRHDNYTLRKRAKPRCGATTKVKHDSTL